jgi:hypothetical protein
VCCHMPALDGLASDCRYWIEAMGASQSHCVCIGQLDNTVLIPTHLHLWRACRPAHRLPVTVTSSL